LNDGITGGAKYLQQRMAVLAEAPSLSFATTAMVLKHAEALQRQRHAAPSSRQCSCSPIIDNAGAVAAAAASHSVTMRTF
jgi:hypothetical protein